MQVAMQPLGAFPHQRSSDCDVASLLGSNYKQLCKWIKYHHFPSRTFEKLLQSVAHMRKTTTI